MGSNFRRYSGIDPQVFNLKTDPAQRDCLQAWMIWILFQNAQEHDAKIPTNSQILKHLAYYRQGLKRLKSINWKLSEPIPEDLALRGMIIYLEDVFNPDSNPSISEDLDKIARKYSSKIQEYLHQSQGKRKIWEDLPEELKAKIFPVFKDDFRFKLESWASRKPRANDILEDLKAYDTWADKHSWPIIMIQGRNWKEVSNEAEKNLRELIEVLNTSESNVSETLKGETSESISENVTETVETAKGEISEGDDVKELINTVDSDYLEYLQMLGLRQFEDQDLQLGWKLAACDAMARQTGKPRSLCWATVAKTEPSSTELKNEINHKSTWLQGILTKISNSQNEDSTVSE